MPRPSKKTPETVALITELLRDGNTRKTAYTAAGISHETFSQWMGKPEFSEAIEKAEAEAVAQRVAVINRAAEKSWQAAAWWLERRCGADFRQQGPVDLRKLSDEQLIRVIFEEGLKQAPR